MAGLPVPQGRKFAGLRHDLLSRVKRPALAVEHVCRSLCHTAVTPILTVRTRSYLLAHILRPITIHIGHQLARRADVQPTLNVIGFRVIPTP